MIATRQAGNTAHGPKEPSVVRLLPHDIEEGRVEIARMRPLLPAAKIKASTKAEYAARVERFKRRGHAALEGVGKRELGVWKAALKWNAAEFVRRAMREADDAWKGRRVEVVGADGKARVRFEPWASEAERWKAWRAAYAKVQRRFAEFERVGEGLAEVEPERDKAKAKQQADHKKRAVRPKQMDQFFAGVPQGSKYRHVFIAASLCGARPEEFAEGVEIRVMRDKERLGLHLKILSRAKCDGDMKGLETAEIFIPWDSVKGGTRERVRELMETARATKGKLLIKVARTEKRTTGQVLTQAIRPFTKKVGFDMSFYSFRHTFAAAAKSAAAAAGLSPTEAAQQVADLMGHQSTDTQRFYGRSDRGAGEFAPESARDPAPEIRIKTRKLPAQKKPAPLGRATAFAMAPPPPR